MLFTRRRLIASIALVVAVVACGDNGDTATGSQANTSTPANETTANETTAPAGPTLTIEGLAFGEPPEVGPGESFTIVNLDSARHTFSSSDGSWEQVEVPAQSQVPFTVPASLAPGRYVFFCAVHSNMGAALTVSG